MKIAKQVFLGTSIALAGAVGLAQPSWAAWRGGGHEGGREAWHGDGHEAHFHGDVRHFDDHDWALWRGGRWEHSRHDGRLGWWWLAGGLWYFYPEPVYPYPDPYDPPVADAEPPAY